MIEFTPQQAADTLGVNRRTIGKAVRRHFDESGHLPPGVSNDRTVYTDEFIDWFASRPYARPELQGLKRDGSYRPKESRPRTAPRDEPDEPVLKATVAKEAQSSHVKAQITGLTAESRKPDPTELWERAFSHQRRDESKSDLRNEQQIIIPDTKPVAVAIMSDPHLDNQHADVIAAKHDADLVAGTDGMYSLLLGDIIDNFIVQKLQFLQREAPFQHRDSLALAEAWIDIQRKKILAVVAGNHDNWTYKQSGLDLLATLLGDIPALYDQHEICFALRLGETASWRFKIRHQWAHKSQYNPSHGQEWDNRFNGGIWDFAMGGHVHGPTLWRDLYDEKERRRKCVVQLGSYELESAFGREHNMARPVPGGSAALMLYPDGSWERYYSLDHAASVLAMERAK